MLFRSRARFDESFERGAHTETLLWRNAPGSLATMPLVAGSTAYGFLLVGFRDAHAFVPQERVLLQTMADALALALERQHLRRSLEEERAQVTSLERRLNSAQEFSSGLLHLVSTELRSPLSSVKAYSESLELVPPQANATRERFMAVIASECDRMEHLLADVNDLSRIEGGECTLRLTGTTLREVGRAVAEAYLPAARERDLTLVFEADDTPVELDVELVRRALANLVNNAIEFSPQGGTVRFTLAGRLDEWTCVVEDQGPPLPNEDLANVFDHFHRSRRLGPPGSPAHARGIAATRLGLAIARGIVELHAGRMWVEQRPAVVGGVVPGPRFC